MACFADIKVSQGSVATYARCGGIFNIHSTANLLRNLPINFFKSVDRIIVMSLWPHFLAHPVYVYVFICVKACSQHMNSTSSRKGHIGIHVLRTTRALVSLQPNSAEYIVATLMRMTNERAVGRLLAGQA